MRTANVPVIINNRNRLSTLRQLIAWLERVGTQDVIIVDNASTYQPLLDFYSRTSHQVIRLKNNVGYLAFWELGIWEAFKDNSYIYTDSDVVPVDECPKNYLDIFYEGLSRYPDVGKVGFSLKIDDLPDEYGLKQNVLSHEGVFWKKKRDELFYEAMIDTTFALYRPQSRGGSWVSALRSAPPYVARHLPWYVNSTQLDEEELFYSTNANKDASWVRIGNQLAEKKLEKI